MFKYQGSERGFQVRRDGLTSEDMMKLPSLNKVRRSSIGTKPESKDCPRADVLQVLPSLVCSSLDEDGRMFPAAQRGDYDVTENAPSKRGEINCFQQANTLPTMPESKSFDKFFQSVKKFP